jgi:hypothetical protein
MICLLPLSRIIQPNTIKILILKLQKKVSNHRKCDSKDSKYRNTLKGMVLGLFTIEEYSFYIKNSSNLNKKNDDDAN